MGDQQTASTLTLVAAIIQIIISVLFIILGVFLSLLFLPLMYDPYLWMIVGWWIFLPLLLCSVWGFIGLTIMNELIIDLFNAPIGLTVLNGSIILALMSVPIIVSIGEDSLKAVPDSYREAAEALGATRWQLIYRVLLPAAKNGLLAAVLLGIARAIGETMAVLMATGHAVKIPTSPLGMPQDLRYE